MSGFGTSSLIPDRQMFFVIIDECCLAALFHLGSTKIASADFSVAPTERFHFGITWKPLFEGESCQWLSCHQLLLNALLKTQCWLYIRWIWHCFALWDVHSYNLLTSFCTLCNLSFLLTFYGFSQDLASYLELAEIFSLIYLICSWI